MAKVLSVKAIFDKVGYQPHAAQRKIHQAKQLQKARFRVVCAGRRTGKSTFGGHELTFEAVRAYYRQNELDPFERRAEFWIVGPEYSDAEKEFRVVWGDLVRLGVPMDHPGSYYNAHNGQMSISLYGGKFLIHCKSAKYPDSLVGEALEGVILAEAAKLKPSIWAKYIRPMLADYRGWAIMTSTPEGRNWFYEMYMMGLNSEHPDWWSIRMPSWANNILFPAGKTDPEIISMSAGMSEEKFKQEIGAEFSEFVGRVFKDFDEEYHVEKLRYNPEWKTFAAIDYGWENPFVWLLIQVDPFDNVYVLGEHYASHLTVEENINEVVKKGLAPASLQMIYPDPASPSDTEIVTRMLHVRAASGTGGPLKDRLELIRRWMKLKMDDRPIMEAGYLKPKLTFDVSCKNMHREFGAYRYPDTISETKEASENPLKKDDHTPEALGRFFAGYYGNAGRAGDMSNLSGGRTRKTRAKIGGRVHSRAR
jgi:hypothetical protein